MVSYKYNFKKNNCDYEVTYDDSGKAQIKKESSFESPAGVDNTSTITISLQDGEVVVDKIGSNYIGSYGYQDSDVINDEKLQVISEVKEFFSSEEAPEIIRIERPETSRPGFAPGPGIVRYCLLCGLKRIRLEPHQSHGLRTTRANAA